MMRKGGENAAVARRRLETFQRAISQPSREQFFEDLERSERAETAKLVREAIPARKLGKSGKDD